MYTDNLRRRQERMDNKEFSKFPEDIKVCCMTLMPTITRSRFGLHQSPRHKVRKQDSSRFHSSLTNQLWPWANPLTSLTYFLTWKVRVMPHPSYGCCENYIHWTVQKICPSLNIIILRSVASYSGRYNYWITPVNRHWTVSIHRLINETSQDHSNPGSIGWPLADPKTHELQ